jgi:exopolysaccharide biosynthesis protein
MIVEGTVITGFYKVEAGRKINVPETGYVVYFSTEATQTTYFITPEIGRSLDMEHVSFSSDSENFDLTNVRNIISGGPRLVKEGFAVTEVMNSFISGRTDNQKLSRIALGTLIDGRVIFVHLSGATIDELSEAMLRLGCVNAVNLEGGGYSAMYVNGSYIVTPLKEGSSAIVITSVK